jgi:hypothetical protein
VILISYAAEVMQLIFFTPTVEVQTQTSPVIAASVVRMVMLTAMPISGMETRTQHGKMDTNAGLSVSTRRLNGLWAMACKRRYDVTHHVLRPASNLNVKPRHFVCR